MAYNNSFGTTSICNHKVDNLSVSWDNDHTDKTGKYPVFLYTPRMNNTDDHHHVTLTREEAQTLHKWLGQYLEDTE